ncbi:uncharacterized protein [Rutidosis leptorrhynchoides]|uniref:uncharacterized protein n=1 Tax=Rutidosis leptorrhynchoides TaxID=125765 RepID=UPI003A993F0F
MLEVVASYDNWIWHAYFGIAWANNDINELNTSPLFESMLNDNFPDIPYVINGVEYKRGYYLAFGIYPQWASFVKAYSSAADPKSKYFSRKQSKVRKDVERTFGILQGRWHIVQQPARAYSVKAIERIICEEYKARTKELHDREVHERLRGDLVEHVWAIRAQEEEDEGEE